MAFTRVRSQSRLRASSVFAGDLPRVLYVEDEDLNWEIAERELDGRYSITRAATAREACELLSKTRYHLILMDIQLSRSELDGIELTRILKNRSTQGCPSFAEGVRAESTPIVFVTAYTARYAFQDLLEAGAEDFIEKPVDFTRLSLLIARLWARASAISA